MKEESPYECIKNNLLKLLPPEQMEKIFNQPDCDIDFDYIGFVDFYFYLSEMIPKHWTIIDIGCSYAPQAFLFKYHKQYFGIDNSVKIRFEAQNTTHLYMSATEFCVKESEKYNFDIDTTFAICQYVPDDNAVLFTKQWFKNVFTYYPAGHEDALKMFDVKNSKE